MSTDAVKQKLTKGQYRVGISFNPSKNQSVDSLKELASTFIDVIEHEAHVQRQKVLEPYTKNGLVDMGSVPDDVVRCTQEIGRCAANAQTYIETAAMYAVKAVTKTP